MLQSSCHHRNCWTGTNNIQAERGKSRLSLNPLLLFPLRCLNFFCLQIAVGLTFLLLHKSGPSCADADTKICGFMCSGVILSTVQFSGLFNDSKTFVDMPLKRNPQCIIDDFNRMKDYSQKRS